MQETRWHPDRASVEGVLRRGTVVYLGLADDSEPYVLPMNYGYRDGALYLHCGHRGRKLEILRRNPRVAFFLEVDRELVRAAAPCSWTVRFRSVMGSGAATVLAEREATLAGYDILVGQHGAQPGAYREEALEKSLVLRIAIEDATLRSKGF